MVLGELWDFVFHKLYSLLSFPQKRLLELVLYKVETVGAKASDNVESNRWRSDRWHKEGRCHGRTRNVPMIDAFLTARKK